MPEAQQSPADPGSDSGDYNDPCQEDYNLFLRQDAETMEEAIGKLTG